ncbi:hypothetical protein K504DRAFT_497924 [Pleomassaria siparia CBS 279.74]|uniref:Uncharacterized protein n=1 Tax=Pleomassaria siparia CBS 279.74 TaxID=1314801 RepID=A0A6G1KKT2_9PLEO|nr:hypothetical protein K504DRAFT_497924 [Pleomassaria siparia CBS 279.74]
MPRPHAGQYPQHPNPGEYGHALLAQRFGAANMDMGLGQPRFPIGSQSSRAWYENPYDSGNENRRRNHQRLRAERKIRIRPQFPMQARYPFGGLGLGGHRHGMPHEHNPFTYAQGPQHQGMARPPFGMSPPGQWPLGHPYGMQPPAVPHGIGPRGHMYQRPPRFPALHRGFPPRSAARRPYYSTASSYGDQYEEDNDDELDMSSRYRCAPDIDDSDDDSSSARPPFTRYDAGPYRRHRIGYDSDEGGDYELDDDEWSEFEGDLRYGSNSGAYRPPRRNLFYPRY